MKKILVLFAHPSIARSEINQPLFNAAGAIENVTAVDLYAEYPDFDINIDREQSRLIEHDVIIFQFPLYWYSTPSLLKEWQDLVLEYGFAYGKGGDKLAGKIFLAAVSAAGSEAAYQDAGDNLFTIRELLRPLEQTAHLCQMIYLPPFVLFRSRSARSEDRLTPHLARWRQLLTGLRDADADLDALQAQQWLD